ncbi:hypothetical protein [Saccharothrix obliqua]|nr:hypothetical protein [Saccharothrix obliqua]
MSERRSRYRASADADLGENTHAGRPGQTRDGAGTPLRHDIALT